MLETPQPARVTHIPLTDIAPNPHNPRLLFDDELMDVLRESINKLGILVPVTVYADGRDPKTDRNRYVLLDGERRWRCSQDLKLPSIPAIVVAKPSPLQNMLTMFHIHNVREGWQLMPTALKLQALMNELKTHNERSLAAITKLTIPQIRRCKILLTYPRRFQNLMLAPVDERLKADFFIELQRIRGPALSERFEPWVSRGDAKSTQIMLDKYQQKIIKAVTDFRRLAEIYRGSVRINRVGAFMKQLDALLSRPQMRISDVGVPGATFAKEAKEIHRSAQRLYSQVRAIDLELVSADVKTIHLLRRLARLLQRKLDKALLSGVRDVAQDND